MSWTEIVGDITGVICVWLVARENVWNWPVGLVNNVFWAVVFWRAKLYSDGTLQGVFFVLGCYGWWRWRKHGAAQTVIPVRRTRAREWALMGAATAAVTAGLAWWLAHHTDSPAPLADASVLALSLAATWGQAEKLVESWWIWIAVDVISVPMYIRRSLYPTAAVYAIFGIICVKGLREWMRTLRGTAS